tara:strand:+ start:642 stop:1211 length:570 start_codon:yes stop_codon:yes gene_type:complete
LKDFYESKSLAHKVNMSFHSAIATQLTPEESTLYAKCKSGQRAGAWGATLVTALEHHGEQSTFRSLLTKIRNLSPIQNARNKNLWIAGILKTSIQEIARFEKKYPEMLPFYQTPQVQPERIAALEARVAHLEQELRRVYDLEEVVECLQGRSSRRRTTSRPRSPDYSPFHPPSTSVPFDQHYDPNNSHW